jgi:hypothetical protein
MAAAYSKPFNICLFWYYIKQIMNVFIRAMVKIFSIGDRWNVPFNSAVASLNGTFHLSPHENILTIALININYLYTVTVTDLSQSEGFGIGKSNQITSTFSI